MYDQTSDKRTIKQELTYRQEIYKELYVQIAEPVVSQNFGN